MALKINGTDISTNRLDGLNITLESLDGAKVYPTDPTANPSIVGASCTIISGGKHITFWVRNNDDAAATINYGNTSSVSLSAGTISPGAQTSQLNIGPYSGLGSATIYARATASGKPQSMVVSQSVSYSLCSG